ncbi:MAG: GNAT family N-acetyltransferase [Saprospiraceae bacterium]|nr:GNAT family N-acetyltransferase [Saprospiraceae bacterium]
MTNLIFRAYRESDYKELVPMILELYADDNATTIGSMTQEQIHRTVQTMNTQPEVGEILVFEIEGQMVGYSILTWFWSNEFGGRMLIIDELLVKESWRNKGIASQFFEWLFAERRYGEMAYELEVGAKKENTIRFYEKQGFRSFKTKHLFRKA